MCNSLYPNEGYCTFNDLGDSPEVKCLPSCCVLLTRGKASREVLRSSTVRGVYSQELGQLLWADFTDINRKSQNSMVKVWKCLSNWVSGSFAEIHWTRILYLYPQTLDTGWMSFTSPWRSVSPRQSHPAVSLWERPAWMLSAGLWTVNKRDEILPSFSWSGKFMSWGHTKKTETLTKTYIKNNSIHKLQLRWIEFKCYTFATYKMPEFKLYLN